MVLKRVSQSDGQAQRRAGFSGPCAVCLFESVVASLGHVASKSGNGLQRCAP